MQRDLYKKLFRIEVVLIILILFGIFFRFNDLDTPLAGDEIIYGIAAMKHHRESFDAGKDYVQEHPPLGKWFVGLPSKFIDADYEPLNLLTKDMFVWGYMAYDALGNNYVAIRIMEAIGGVMSLFLIFLITRRLFGFRAALWSTVIAALSFEMIGYSRIIFMESPMIVFTLLSLFLYINYLKSSGKKRFVYLGLFLASLTVTLLTRHIQPLFLLPIFVVSQFLLNRDLKENIYFLLFLGIAYYMVFNVIFPQDILGYGQSRFGYSSIFGFFSVKPISVIGHLIFRNSFLFLVSLIATGYLIIRMGKKTYENIHPVLIIFFVLSFLIFSFLSFPLPRHYIFMFIPLYIVGGYALNQITKNKVLGAVIILLAIINVGMLAERSPEFLTYTNFGLDSFQSVPGVYKDVDLLPKKLAALSNETTSVVMTNDVNILIFFDGQKLPLVPALDSHCNNATIDLIDVDNLTIVYIPPAKDFTPMNDPFVCPLLKEKLAQATNVRYVIV